MSEFNKQPEANSQPPAPESTKSTEEGAKRDPSRRGVLIGGGILGAGLLGGGVVAGSLLSRNNNAEPKPVATDSEAPSNDPPAEKPTSDVDKEVRFEAVAYGGVEPGLSNEELGEQIAIPAETDVKKISDETLKAINAALMYGATPEFAEKYSEPGSLDSDEYKQERSDIVDGKLSAIAESIADTEAYPVEEWMITPGEGILYVEEAETTDAMTALAERNLDLYVESYNSKDATEPFSFQFEYQDHRFDMINDDPRLGVVDILVEIKSNPEQSGVEDNFTQLLPDANYAVITYNFDSTSDVQTYLESTHLRYFLEELPEQNVRW